MIVATLVPLQSVALVLVALERDAEETGDHSAGGLLIPLARTKSLTA